MSQMIVVVSSDYMCVCVHLFLLYLVSLLFSKLLNVINHQSVKMTNVSVLLSTTLQLLLQNPNHPHPSVLI